jgi:hypothetical protein
MRWPRVRRRHVDQVVAWAVIIIVVTFTFTLLWLTAMLLAGAVEYRGELTTPPPTAADWRGGTPGGVKPE